MNYTMCLLLMFLITKLGLCEEPRIALQQAGTKVKSLEPDRQVSLPVGAIFQDQSNSHGENIGDELQNIGSAVLTGFEPSSEEVEVFFENLGTRLAQIAKIMIENVVELLTFDEDFGPTEVAEKLKDQNIEPEIVADKLVDAQSFETDQYDATYYYVFMALGIGVLVCIFSLILINHYIIRPLKNKQFAHNTQNEYRDKHSIPKFIVLTEDDLKENIYCNMPWDDENFVLENEMEWMAQENV